MMQPGDIYFQQDTQEVPELPPEDEPTICSAEDELFEHHLHWNKLSPMFPPDCLQIVRLMKGNDTCVDCRGYDDVSGVIVEPMYASTTHGTLLCRKCSIGHRNRDERAFGIRSFVNDPWTFGEILSLTEGGNAKFQEFCAVTNAYPTLAADVDNHKQFIDGLYASVPVKAYRSLLRKAVAKTTDDHQALLQSHHQRHGATPREYHFDDTCHPTSRDVYARFGKELPMMPLYDFYTIELKKTWPQSEDDIISELEASTMEDLNDDNLKSKLDIGEEKKDDLHHMDVRDTDPVVSGDDKSADPSLFGTTLTSLFGDECSTSEQVIHTKKESEYQLPLKNVDDSVVAQTKKRLRPKTSRSLSPVPESKAASMDSDDVSLISREEIMLKCRSQNHDTDDYDDDGQSVISTGSSVGSLGLRSMSDSQSVASADLEPIPTVNKDDAMVQNLEPTATQDTVRSLKSEVTDTTFGPEGVNESVQHINELDSSGMKSRVDISIEENLTEEKVKTSSLQRSIQLLDAAIGNSDSNDQHRSTPTSNGRSKLVQFGGLPEKPPERTKDRPRNRGKRQVKVDVEQELKADVEQDLNYISKASQPRRFSGLSNGNSIQISTARPESHELNERGRRLPLPINGRMGPPLVKSTTYTPQRRPSFKIGHLGNNDTDDSAPQRAPSPQQQALSAAASRVHSAYKHQIKNITRNFVRQPAGKGADAQQGMPEYNGNLAPQAQLEISTAHRARSSSEEELQRPNLSFLIAKSRQNFSNNKDRLSSSLRGNLSSKDS